MQLEHGWFPGRGKIKVKVNEEADSCLQGLLVLRFCSCDSVCVFLVHGGEFYERAKNGWVLVHWTRSCRHKLVCIFC